MGACQRQGGQILRDGKASAEFRCAKEGTVGLNGSLAGVTAAGFPALFAQVQARITGICRPDGEPPK